MLSEPVRNVMEPSKLLVAAPDSSVSAAAKLMADKRAGAVMVLEGTRLIGIFTERDLLVRVVAPRGGVGVVDDEGERLRAVGHAGLGPQARKQTTTLHQ